MTPKNNENIDQFIERLEHTLPSGLLTAPQIVSSGLVKSPTTLYKWREEGRGPRYLKLEDGVCRYLKEDIIDWVKKSYTPQESILEKGVPSCQ